SHEIRVECVVRTPKLLARGKPHVAVWNVRALERAANGAARGRGEEKEQLGDAQLLEDRDEHVRPLDRLRFVPGAEADTVLLKGADNERRLRNAELCARRTASFDVPEREVLEVDSDRYPEHLYRVDTCRSHEVLHLPMRDLHAIDTRRVLAERVERT